ncbi:MAG TPA: hypothetical protein VK668_12095 [Mucilaginibacter sp.]|nr:hypothetical protein [Mucilaginibacter sp.]
MNSDRGNREWINDYMSLKQVNPNNPFTVPEGYFDELEQQIVSYVKLDDLKKSAPEQGFTVPENYFEDLSSTIKARISVEEALDKEDNNFTVPEGYFENLSQQIQSRILVEETLGQQAETFTVPENYFAGLTESILNKTVNEQPVQQKGVVRRLFASAAFKYAVAACLTLAVGGTIFLSRTPATIAVDNHSFLRQSLSAISVDDIQSYLQSNLDPTDTHTLTDDGKVNADNLTKDELQDYLDTSQ